MPLKKGKSPGWAAVDLKQQRGQGQFPVEPYPPIQSSIPPRERNTISSARSFSSLVIPKDCRKLVHAGDSSGKLESIHCWADDGLIADVLAATNNHIDEASSLLKAMEGNDKNDVVEQIRRFDTFTSDKDINTRIGMSDFTEPTSTPKDDMIEALVDEYASIGESNSYDAKMLAGSSRTIPVEPEWIDNDIDMYLTHRKDAIRMMRLASQHSRAATSAYQRGDHFAARQHSLEAQEERVTAEKLNAKAAKEILGIRNSQNDMWKLDLHGLHAAEAVEALQGHLLRIETRLSLNRSVSPNKLMTDNEMKRSSSLGSFSSMNLERLRASTRQQQMALQVITGVGNHSQGQAALPIAIRGFLNENRYRFDETRPGMITVRPKFRQR